MPQAVFYYQGALAMSFRILLVSFLGTLAPFLIGNSLQKLHNAIIKKYGIYSSLR